MPLDKETIHTLWNNASTVDDVDSIAYIHRFAQAIYDLGVKEERERCAMVADSGRAWRIAEAIRKGT